MSRSLPRNAPVTHSTVRSGLPTLQSLAGTPKCPGAPDLSTSKASILLRLVEPPSNLLFAPTEVTQGSQELRPGEDAVGCLVTGEMGVLPAFSKGKRTVEKRTVLHPVQMLPSEDGGGRGASQGSRCLGS